MYDTNLFSIHLQGNEDRDSLPGLVAMQPPKRTARGRENDVLIAFIKLDGNSTISDASLQAWIQKKGEEYYQTAGTVTFALRSMMEKINQEMLDRNIKRAKDGAQLTASLSLVVVKRDLLYLASAGGTKSFFISNQELVELTGEEQPRGLGLNETLPIRFSQKELHENDLLLLSPQLVDSWSVESLAGSHGLSIESLSRRLFNLSRSDLKAALLKFTPGKGGVSINALHRTQSAPLSNDKDDVSAEVTPTIITPVEISQIKLEPQSAANPVPDTQDSPKSGGGQGLTRQTSDVETGRRRPATRQPLLSPRTKVAIGKTAQSTVNIWDSTKSRTFLFLRKLLPGLVDEPVKLNKPVLIFIALVVPLILLLIAGSVYVNKGKSREFNASLIQAQQYLLQAEGTVNDEPSRLASLQQAMFWLDKAAEYGQSESLDTLTLQVRTSLDQLQGIKRLELTPLFSDDLAKNARITQMVATNSDVYLLDETSGTVKRYYLSGNEYLADSGFDCGYNPANLLSPIGRLVDMVAAPAGNSFRAAVMVIDAAGVIEYCIPGEAGITGSLTPPDAGWISLKSISLFQGYLYILDTGGNAVYRYAGSGIQFDEKPTLFFDNQIPALSGAFDIEVNGEELYILRTTGEMVECTYSPLKDYKLTECADPAPYGDMRTGALPQTVTFPETDFIQMKMTPSPDSSIYILDAKSRAVYHFSLQRNLQKIMHPILRDGEDINRLTPTALAISSGRIAFVAFENKVYFSPLP